jgi:RecJ-like exonuclease
MVPMFDTITAVLCKNCGGKGYIEDKCRNCKDSGKIEDNLIVLEGEDQNKDKKTFSYPCNVCYGTGKSQTPCKECGGFKNLYKYQILPVPFETVITGIPILHSSLKTKYEKEIGKDLQDLIDEVEGIKFNDFKELEKKAEPSLGYWDKQVKKTVNSASDDYKSFDKDKDTQIVTQIYLFPMIQLNCKTKKGKSFEIFSIGSENKFLVYSNF